MSNILANNINPRNGTSIDVGGALQVGSATTIHTTGIDLGSGNIQSHNINSTGIITATSASFSGNVSIGGTLTYEDVTSIDSVGVITARNGLDVSGITTVTGAVSVNGNNYPSSGFFSYRNLVINGAMEVAQRGTSGSANGTYNCVDRISRGTSGVTGGVTDSQEALSSGDPYDEGFRSFFRVTKTDASTDFIHSHLTISYKFEAGDIACSGWKYTDPNSYITVSFWVRANYTQDYGFGMQTHDGSSYVYNKKFGLVANTWKKIIQKVPGNANISFNNDTGLGLTFDWYPYLGGTYNNATDDSWDEAYLNKYGDNLGSTWWTSGDSTFDITGFQVEVGDVATPFEHKPYPEEVTRCQRYFQKFYYTAHSYPFGYGYVYATTKVAATVNLATTMRTTTPTVTANDLVVRGFAQDGNNTTATINSVNTAQTQLGHTNLQMDFTTTTIAAAAKGAACVIANDASNATSNLSVDAEL